VALSEFRQIHFVMVTTWIKAWLALRVAFVSRRQEPAAA
jgi:hypothetical protein